MQFERAQPSIVRSIRHVSLMKDWTRARRGDLLPRFSDFVPDDRSGDSVDLLIVEARQKGGELRLFCRSAGARVEQILDRQIKDRYICDILDAHLVTAAQPIWHGCLTHGMPIFSVVTVTDRDGCPATIEQIYLPYRSTGEHADIVVSAFHAWSTEGRFAIQGLLSNLPAVPRHWVAIIDPALVVSAADRSDQIEVS